MTIRSPRHHQTKTETNSNNLIKKQKKNRIILYLIIAAIAIPTLIIISGSETGELIKIPTETLQKSFSRTFNPAESEIPSGIASEPPNATIVELSEKWPATSILYIPLAQSYSQDKRSEEVHSRQEQRDIDSRNDNTASSLNVPDENQSETNTSEGQTGMELPSTDDAELDTLIAESAIPCTLLALQMVLAIDQCDETRLVTHAEELLSLTIEKWEQADKLTISRDNLPRKTAFLRSMEEFLVASHSLRLGLPLSIEQKNRDISNIIKGTEKLMEATKEGSAIVMTQDMIRHPSTLNHYKIQTQYPDARRVNERFIYFDSKKANQISAMPRRVFQKSQFWYNTPTGTVQYTAPIGYTYVFVNIQYTHLGNYIGSHYTTTTPNPSAHTISAHERDYRPLEGLPEFFSEGEIYTRKTLNRGERTEGFLIFEVPSIMDINDMYLKVNFGGEYGVQVWNLGSE